MFWSDIGYLILISFEETFNIEEITKAVKNLPHNKCPGPDGFPCEFYMVFWSDIGYLVFDSFNKAYEHGELSPTQKQGIINLIPKKIRT